jgi:hypothetical protein
MCVFDKHTHTRRYRLTKQAAFPSFVITLYSATSHNDVIIKKNNSPSLYTLQFYTIPNPYNGKWGLISSELHNTLSVKCILIFDSKKVKVKITLEQATKAQRGSRCIGLFFL